MMELQRKREVENRKKMEEKLRLEKEAEERDFALKMEELDMVEAAAGSGVPLDVLETMGMMSLKPDTTHDPTVPTSLPPLTLPPL